MERLRDLGKMADLGLTRYSSDILFYAFLCNAEYCMYCYQAGHSFFSNLHIHRDIVIRIHSLEILVAGSLPPTVSHVVDSRPLPTRTDKVHKPVHLGLQSGKRSKQRVLRPKGEDAGD